jgi:hypothetical protein
MHHIGGLGTPHGLGGSASNSSAATSAAAQRGVIFSHPLPVQSSSLVGWWFSLSHSLVPHSHVCSGCASPSLPLSVPCSSCVTCVRVHALSGLRTTTADDSLLTYSSRSDNSLLTYSSHSDSCLSCSPFLSILSCLSFHCSRLLTHPHMCVHTRNVHTRNVHTHTHTHTHIYIYIYIYIHMSLTHTHTHMHSPLHRW